MMKDVSTKEAEGMEVNNNALKGFGGVPAIVVLILLMIS